MSALATSTTIVSNDVITKKTPTAKIHYCIFDMDGLLLDTERIYSEVTSEILSRYNIKYTWDIKSKLMGLNQKMAAETLIRETGAPMTPDDYLKERNAKQAERFPNSKPLPGVVKLISHLKASGIPIAVATSSHHDHFLLKSKNNQELFKLFNVIVTGDDPHVKNGKPAPDLFLEAARRLGVDVDQDHSSCLVFEDAPSGVQAALAAKMHVIWIPDPNMSRDPKLEDEADQIMFSMENFKPEEWGLPGYPQ